MCSSDLLENKRSLVLEPIDIAHSILRVHASLKPLIKEKELHVDLNLEEAVVMGDPKKLETVIRNLYNNAIFYTPPKERIEWTMEVDRDTVKLGITNYGITIEESLLTQLWEPFYRIDQSRNKELGGSGLGLYMVKQIVEAHSGDCGVIEIGRAHV